MIVLDVPQRSDAWVQARLGVISASNFGRILTPTGSPSKQATDYRHDLLAEWLTGRALPSFSNEWTERGTELEQQARDYYELITDRTVEQVGFVYKDERRLVGCSPDGIFDGGKSGLEIKVLKPGNHVEHLLGAGTLPLKYKPQVQGGMLVTGAESWDWLSWHPDMPPVLVTIQRDEKYIAALDSAIEAFIEELLKGREQILARGLAPKSTAEMLEASLEMLRASV